MGIETVVIGGVVIHLDIFLVVVNVTLCCIEVVISEVAVDRQRIKWRSKHVCRHRISLSLTIGPPRVKPNMFQRRGARGAPCQLLAFSTLLRKNSNRSPCNTLVPDLIDTLTMPPSKLPNSAGAFSLILNGI
jgi:hypothetical protein